MGRDVVAGCHDDAALATTAFVQPALLAVGLAGFAVCGAEGMPVPVGVAGHSLGEFAALVAADVLALPEALDLVVIRGEAMQRAGEANPGTMTALLGVDAGAADGALRRGPGRGHAPRGANENSPVQVVASGSVPAIERLEALAKERQTRAVRLPVAGAFHSPLMRAGGRPRSTRRIDAISFRAPRFPIAENVSGELVDDPGACGRSLKRAGGLARAVGGLCAVARRRRRHDLRRGRRRRRPDEAHEADRRRGPSRSPWGRPPRPARCSRRSRPTWRRPISSGTVTRHATITGVGSSLPPRLVPNTWFEDQVDDADQWIRERTGIEARHFVDDGVVTSDLAVEAARIALDTAGISPEQLDMIVCRERHRRHPVPGDRGVGPAEARVLVPRLRRERRVRGVLLRPRHRDRVRRVRASPTRSC